MRVFKNIHFSENCVTFYFAAFKSFVEHNLGFETLLNFAVTLATQASQL